MRTVLIFFIISGCVYSCTTDSQCDARGTDYVSYWMKYRYRYRYSDLDFLDSTRYLPLGEMYSYLRRLARTAPNIVSLESIGNTYIKGKSLTNPIYLVTIGNKNDPILFFDCGIHAREWISRATCLYLIQQLTKAFKSRTNTRSPRRYGHNTYHSPVYNYQWQFIPMANPDGYAKTHIPDLVGEGKHRLYRKNRRNWKTLIAHLSDRIIEHCEDEGDCCGVDLNRNFPAGGGLGHPQFEIDSTKPWSVEFKGIKPLSEPETRTIARHIMGIRDRTLLAISVHSYGKDIIYPKGWLKTNDPDQIKGREKQWLRNFAEYFNKPLGFSVGSVSEILPDTAICGGATDDFYWTTVGINLTYTIELHPSQNETDINWKLPASCIIKVGKKMWKALQLMALKMDQLYPYYKK